MTKSGYLTLKGYVPVQVSPVSLIGDILTLNIDNPKGGYVSLFIIVDGKAVAHKTSSGPIIKGQITVERIKSRKFSIFAFSSPDGVSNGALGKTYWGVYLSKINQQDLVKFNMDDDLSSTTIQDAPEPMKLGAYIFTIPVENTSYIINYVNEGYSSSNFGSFTVG